MGNFVSNRDETVRLFENPVLEYFTHIHPATPAIVFSPVIVYMMYRSAGILSPLLMFGMFFVGLFLWTITEYAIHRWIFHYEPRSDFGKRIHFFAHGIHHAYPRDSTRLVLPPLISAPLATVFYFAFRSIFGDFAFAIFAGFIFGYVSYDSIHYATHHFPMTSRVGKFLKTYHLKHHYTNEHSAFGVSNPLWDYVFRTTPPYLREESEKGKEKNA